MKATTAEDIWTQSICDILREENLGENIYVDVLTKIPYALEVFSFSTDFGVRTDSLTETTFQTDMVIYEKKAERIIPRVVIEAKIKSVTTHDAITYSQKALYHKNVIPFLRYGIMLGDRKDYALPGRLFRHGTNFDFLFSFQGAIPSNKEKEAFIAMLKKEIDYSRQMEYVLGSSRKRSRKKYFLLQKEFHLEEK